MLTTRFTKLVGCTLPIQQAGMGAASPSELAAAVADRTAAGEVGAMALHAGESVSAVKRVLPAREVVRELAEEAEEFLRLWKILRLRWERTFAE
jgi:NAD(P)H-dependent flavin oxidoreductase YrpB (nitropropane dioxygenase family)